MEADEADRLVRRWNGQCHAGGRFGQSAASFRANGSELVTGPLSGFVLSLILFTVPTAADETTDVFSEYSLKTCSFWYQLIARAPTAPLKGTGCRSDPVKLQLCVVFGTPVPRHQARENTQVAFENL